MVVKKEAGSKKQEQLVKKLIDNFASLQKVMTNLAVKFDSLSDQLSKLLSLFEISAKSLAEKKGKSEGLVDGNFLKKLDEILDQNKTIARGMVLIGERLTELEDEEGIKEGKPNIGKNMFPPRTRLRPRPLPRY